jgi:hypothetical protein
MSCYAQLNEKERDEEQTRTVYKWEKKMRRTEYLQMNKEERELREHFRRVDEAEAEDKAIAAAIAQGVRDAQNFLLTSDGKKMLHSRGEKLLREKMNGNSSKHRHSAHLFFSLIVIFV